MIPAYIKKLGLQTQKINLGAQKIDKSNITIYKIVIIGFQVLDKLDKACFF